ncbi:MAG: sigma-70 family RNA polymerase sigma factor [Bacteroidia bacterium]|nr:sigma-70 family RNA polymerase sigma factor [Bacteroidia bacterium]
MSAGFSGKTASSLHLASVTIPSIQSISFSWVPWLVVQDCTQERAPPLVGEAIFTYSFSCNQPSLLFLRGILVVRKHNPQPINDDDLHRLLKACRRHDRYSQDRLYQYFYGYALGICLRYSRSRDEAIEIVNDGYLKIFSNLDKYTEGLSFKGWLRKIMINASIDYFRRNEKHHAGLDISYVQHEPDTANALSQLSAADIINAVQSLPASYRMVFNLFVIEGFKHEEISAMLHISVGTSKSNLAVARSKLRRILDATGEEMQRRKKHG